MQVTKEYSGIEVTVNEEDLNKQGVIYLLEFPNGKVYIGQTTQKLRVRTNHHCDTKHDTCVKLNRAINKYKAFKLSVLEENLTIGQLNAFEPYYIKLFNANGEDGYNLEAGGQNREHSEETRLKISKANKGYKHTAEAKKKISESKKGKTHKNMKPHSEETRIKMSESQKGNRNRSEKVKSIPDNTTFNSITECAKHYNICRTQMSRYYNGKVHKKSGQTFVIVEE